MNTGEFEKQTFESAKLTFEPSSLVEHGDVPGLTESVFTGTGPGDGNGQGGGYS